MAHEIRRQYNRLLPIRVFDLLLELLLVDVLGRGMESSVEQSAALELLLLLSSLLLLELYLFQRLGLVVGTLAEEVYLWVGHLLAYPAQVVRDLEVCYPVLAVGLSLGLAHLAIELLYLGLSCSFDELHYLLDVRRHCPLIYLA